jgi:long-chain acyl-CoA synthetase
LNILDKINKNATFSDDVISIKGADLVALVDVYLKITNIRKYKIALLVCDNTLGWLIIYLACLKAQVVPILIPKNSENSYLNMLASKFKANLIIDSTIYDEIFDSKCVSKTCLIKEDVCNYINSKIAIVLTTSGSTGSPKCVLLSKKNITSNAKAISDYLGLLTDDVGLVQLPTSYSYGLSIVNSHLAAGSAIHLTNMSLFDANFLPSIDKHRITNISGVPSSYEMIFRIGLIKKKFESLRFLTQAGGNLGLKYKKIFNRYCLDNGLDFYVMYGQTEAGPRIAYVPPASLNDNFDCIGIPIPGGALSIDSDTGELVYEGPNVMLGYAENFEDLARGDVNKGILKTGDIAVQGSNGFFKIVGRLKRIIKVTGIRYNLDDLERQLSEGFEKKVFTCGLDEKLSIIIEGPPMESISPGKVSKMIGIHKTKFKVLFAPEIPILPSGKVDYSELAKI